MPEIAREFGIVCLVRENDPCESIIQSDPLLRSLSDCIELLETPACWRNVSSSAVRKLLRENRADDTEWAPMVPEEIRDLVRKGADHGRNML